MKLRILQFYLLLLVGAICTSLSAQNTPSSSSYRAISVGIGGAILSDEYLTPLRYGGSIYGLRWEEEKALKLSLPILLHSDASFAYATVLNPAYTAKMDFIRGEFQTEGLYLWQLPYGVKFATGPGVRLTMGGRLHSRNGNNPATLDAKADLTIGTTIAYRLPFETWPIAFRWRVTYGLIGLSNHLAYGESYYEREFIRNGVARSFLFTHPFNQNYFATRMTIDIPLWNLCTLHVGYQWSYDKSSLKRRIRSAESHMAFIGFSLEQLTFKGRKAMRNETHRTLLFDTFQ